MQITNDKLLNYLYEKKLPQVYRTMDSSLRTRPFYRYLQALLEGGYGEQLKDINMFVEIVDPKECPEEVLPYFMESFGLTYYPVINVAYQRKFLSNIGELLKRRGTHSVVSYLVRTLTGLNIEQRYFRGEYKGYQGRHLLVTLLADSIGDLQNMHYYIFIVEKYLKDFIPYYIYPWLDSSVKMQRLETTRYKASVVGYSINYNNLGKNI